MSIYYDTITTYIYQLLYKNLIYLCHSYRSYRVLLIFMTTLADTCDKLQFITQISYGQIYD
jgi:hypothetical protein